MGATLETRDPIAAIEDVKAIASAGGAPVGAAAGAGARRAKGLAEGAGADGAPKREASGCASLRPKSFGILISGRPRRGISNELTGAVPVRSTARRAGARSALARVECLIWPPAAMLPHACASGAHG